MAIFQCHIQVISRGEGRSVVSAAAYRSASRIENNYTGLTDDYTQKGWVEYSEIILPPNAPGEWNDRAVLWNAVEEAEKSRDCRLAREIEVALPQELSLQENIRLVQEFVQDSFVSDGMIADINIHNPPVRDSSGIPVDADGNRVTDRKDMVFRNPHAHILLTLRPLDENGRWMPKTEKEYLCKKGNQTKAFTAEEFKAAKEEGWQKQYQYYKGKKKVWLTPSEAFEGSLIRASKYPRCTPGRQNEKARYWNSREAILAYRKSWEEHVNLALERAGRPERVDCRSYKAQGLDTIPGIHLGSYASRQTDSDRYRANEEIQELNRKNEDIQKSLDEVEKEIEKKKERLFDRLAEQLGKIRGDILSVRYDLESLLERQAAVETERKRLDERISRVRTIRENALERDRASKEKIARLKKEAADFPARKDSLGEAIQAEQEAVRFRRERLDRVLAEEGFDSLSDYLQEAQILSQMELEAETLEQEITRCREQTEELERRYGELEGKLDAEDLKGFEPWREKWSGRYEKKATERIRKRKGGFRMYLFERAVQNTGYSLRHGAYLAGRAAYVVKEMVQAAEETDGQGRKR